MNVTVLFNPDQIDRYPDRKHLFLMKRPVGAELCLIIIIWSSNTYPAIIPPSGVRGLPVSMDGTPGSIGSSGSVGPTGAGAIGPGAAGTSAIQLFGLGLVSGFGYFFHPF
jgi:hypothetical protein